MAVGKENDMVGEGGYLAESELSRRRALLGRRQDWKFHHWSQPVDPYREKFSSGVSRLIKSFDLQQGAGAEPLLGMLASVARVLISLCGLGYSLCGLGNNLWFKNGLCGLGNSLWFKNGLCGLGNSLWFKHGLCGLGNSIWFKNGL